MKPDKKILIVDDEPLNCELLESTILTFGYQSQSALSGEAALALIDETTDLVLLDAMMPGLDGFEVARRIRANPSTAGTPIIMVTALTGKEERLKAVATGANDFIEKPIDRIELQVRSASLLKMKEAQDSARAKQEQLQAQNEELKTDLDLARAMQLAYIVKPLPVFPRGAAPEASLLRFYQRYIPASVLGGDFFVVLQISDTVAGVFLCDVMGHGVRSALVTAMIRAVVGETGHVAATPGRFLAVVNQHLAAILAETGVAMFVSAFFATIDLESGHTLYANAGHASPIVARTRIGVTQWMINPLEDAGPALGLFADASYTTHHYQLTPGDRLLLFTDGLVEVEADGDEYGEERLLAAVARNQHLAPEELCDQLLNEVRDFSPTGEFEDDVCLLAIELRG